MTGRQRREPRPSKVDPHPYVPDYTVPLDWQGRAYCATCHCPGRPGDDRHPLPDPAHQEEHRRRSGDRPEENP